MQALVRLVPFETRKGTSQEDEDKKKIQARREGCVFLCMKVVGGCIKRHKLWLEFVDQFSPPVG